MSATPSTPHDIWIQRQDAWLLANYQLTRVQAAACDAQTRARICEEWDDYAWQVNPWNEPTSYQNSSVAGIRSIWERAAYAGWQRSYADALTYERDPESGAIVRLAYSHAEAINTIRATLSLTEKAQRNDPLGLFPDAEAYWATLSPTQAATSRLKFRDLINRSKFRNLWFDVHRTLRTIAQNQFIDIDDEPKNATNDTVEPTASLHNTAYA